MIRAMAVVLLLMTQSPGGAATRPGSAPATSAPASAPVETSRSVRSVVTDAASLLGPTFEDTSIYGWLTLLGGILLGMIAGRVTQALLSGAGNRLQKREWPGRGAVLRHAAGPANLALVTFGLAIGLQGVVMDDRLAAIALRIVALLYIIAIAWFAYNLVGMVDIIMRRLVLRTRTALDDTILSVVRKALRVFLIVMMSLFVAENVFGAHIGTWLAGLGIAGLAVSLAAQDPIKNLFGSFTMLVERPFGLGDRIMFNNIDGTVEEIGLRSTRIRTGIGHLVAVPNMKFTDSVIENISRRPSLRRTINLNLPYDTPPEKVEEALQVLKAILHEPEIAAELNMPAEPPQILLSDFKPGSMSVAVNYWYAVNQPGRDIWTFQRHAEIVNLRIVRALKQAGVRLV